MPFLAHVVCRKGLECDPRKIEDVKTWPVPDCLKSVRQFLGCVGYYRHFIPIFADLAEPLVALTSKDVPFIWRPPVPQHSLIYEMLWSGRLSWLFRQNRETTYWTQTLAISDWEVSLAKYRITWSVSLPTAVAPCDHHNGNTALQREKCWWPSQCVYSFAHICAALSSPYIQTISLWYGYIDSKIQKV